MIISIHALLAESDLTIMLYDPSALIFLSTLSLRRATAKYALLLLTYHHFYPRSPCGERRIHYDNYNLHCVISIHALLAESDFIVGDVMGKALAISIHALLAESDSGRTFGGQEYQYFYPRSPCGERRASRLRRLSP